MRRQLLVELYNYFETIGEKRSEREEYLFRQLNGELPYFSISSLHRDDLENEGFDVSGVTDNQMETIAGRMGDDYCEQLYWGSLRIIAGECIGIPKKETDKYVLVEFPEDASYFEENGIGYPCFSSEDNGARYVPETAYLKHFGHDPQPNSYFQAVRWPKSQEFMTIEDEAIADLCEPITADEKALNDFGSSAIWVPLCLINDSFASGKTGGKLEKPTVCSFTDSGDFVHCNHCDTIMLLPSGADKCPLCMEEGALIWEDEGRQEATHEELSESGKYKMAVKNELQPQEYLSDFDVRQEELEVGVEKIMDANFWSSL